MTERSYLRGIERLIGHSLTVVGDTPASLAIDGPERRNGRRPGSWQRSGGSLGR